MNITAAPSSSRLFAFATDSGDWNRHMIHEE